MPQQGTVALFSSFSCCPDGFRTVDEGLPRTPLPSFACQGHEQPWGQSPVCCTQVSAGPMGGLVADGLQVTEDLLGPSCVLLGEP